MHIETLNIEEFNLYQERHHLSNFYQTVNYGMLKAENGYDYDLIGLKDENGNIQAASLILLKQIGVQSYYGYAPRGFLIDYNNERLMNIFTTKLKEYYALKKVIFIKLNPYIPIGEIDRKDYSTTYNKNIDIRNILNNNDYKKLADNLYFESQLPRFNAFVDLKNFKASALSKNNRNKIKKGMRKGLVFEKVSKDQLEIFNNMLNDKDNNPYYYHDYYTTFDKDNNIDLFLVSIDYNIFLQNSEYIYNNELNNNSLLNDKLIRFGTEKNINAKMASDKVLLTYKDDVLEASKGLGKEEKKYIAGALVVKHNDMVTIIRSTFDKNYKRFAPNYFLYYSIIKYYQEAYDYLDLNGIVGNFKEENPYSGLNRFKLGFNPHIYEFIGEYDLIINAKLYDSLLRNGFLQNEFDKKNSSW